MIILTQQIQYLPSTTGIVPWILTAVCPGVSPAENSQIPVPTLPAIPGIFRTVSVENTSPGGGVGDGVGDGSCVFVSEVVTVDVGVGDVITLVSALQDSTKSDMTVMTEKILLGDIFPPYWAGKCI